MFVFTQYCLTEETHSFLRPLSKMDKLFRLYDTNRDGILSKVELKSLLVEALTMKNNLEAGSELWRRQQAPSSVAILANAKASGMLRKFDADKSKSISFDEFVGIVLEHPLLMATFSYWKELFAEADADGEAT